MTHLRECFTVPHSSYPCPHFGLNHNLQREPPAGGSGRKAIPDAGDRDDSGFIVRDRDSCQFFVYVMLDWVVM